MTTIGDSADSGDTTDRPRLAIVALMGGAGLIIACGWLVGWLLLGEYRPELTGARFNSDLAHPAPGTVMVCAALAVVAIATAIALVLRPRCDRRTRLVAAFTIDGAVGILILRAALSAPGERCSADPYANTLTCASGRAAMWADILLLAVPTAIAVAAILIGTRWPRAAAARGPSALPFEPARQ